MSNVVIDIAAEFTGKKAFKQADSAAAKLNGNIKKLAGTFGLAFGAQAVVQFGKAAVKAFTEDEKAATRLARAVDNLGIGFANPAIATYISNLEKTSAIADDILRPAFQGLLTTTGSLTQSQKLLNDAITISRASGIDLATVADDLAKGYIGTTKGLSKYNTGLSKAELQSKSFNEILGVTLKRSAGAAEDYLGTTAYKFDVLSVASNNASEIIGGSLVDAFALIGGGTEASDAAYAIETIATALGKIVVQSGRTIGVIPTLIKNLKNLPKSIFFGFVGKSFGTNIVPPTKKEEVKLTLTEKKQQELLAKLEKESLRREKERLALKNKQVAAERLRIAITRAETALGRGTDIFDIEKIQLNAAMINQAEQLGKVTSQSQLLMIANDIARLTIKQDILALEAAIASKDEEAIIAATNKLNADLKILGALGMQNIKLVDIKKILETIVPKGLIDQKNLDDALRKIQEMLALLAKVNQATGTPTKPDPPFKGQPIIPKLVGNESIEAITEFSDAVTELANAMADAIEAQNAEAMTSFANSSLAKYQADYIAAIMERNRERFGSSGQGTQITIVDKTSGLIQVVQNAIIQNNKYGNSLVTAGSL